MFTVEEQEFYDAFLRDMELSGLQNLLTPEKAEKAVRLFVLLLEENRLHNLTAIKTPSGAALLHFTDSLTASHLFPLNAKVIDVGCGGGFPTLPLALFRPDLRIIACDATAKKTAFVEKAASELGLPNVSVMTGRAEELAFSPVLRERFDVATARAVAALPVLSELCLPFVKVGGIFIALKGASAEEERLSSMQGFKALGAAYKENVSLPLTDGTEVQSRTAVIVEKTEKCSPLYPRQYAKILKKPL